jgi:hypothetical protein
MNVAKSVELLILENVFKSHPHPVNILAMGPQVALDLGNGMSLMDIFRASNAMEDVGLLARVDPPNDEHPPRVRTRITVSGIDYMKSLRNMEFMSLQSEKSWWQRYWSHGPGGIPVHDEHVAELRDEGQNSSRQQKLNDHLRNL